MKPVRKEITKTEWAVCQLYPPSKRTFGAGYWVAPEQKWTSLDSLRGDTECRLPLWFATVGEVEERWCVCVGGWTISRTGNKYPSWGKLLAVFFVCWKKQERGKWQYISFRKWVRNTVLFSGETGYHTFNRCYVQDCTSFVTCLKSTLGFYSFTNPGAC